jgi:hypothetical protein
MNKYTFYIELYYKDGESSGRHEATFDFEEFKVSIEVHATFWRKLSASRLVIQENQTGLTFATTLNKLDVDSIVVYDTDVVKIYHEINILNKDKPVVHTDVMAEGVTRKLVFNRDL